MHVAQFLDALLLGEHVKVIKPRLPKAAGCSRGEECALASVRFSTDERAAGDGLLERLHCGRKIFALRLGDEQMDVLGHDDVADDAEAVGDARLFEDAQDEVAPASGSQERTAMVTTAGDEVEMSVSVEALEIARHRGSLSRGNRFHPDKQRRLVWGTHDVV